MNKGNKIKKADLHIHTTASDGRASPEEIVERAYAEGLSAISITDHDTYAAYKKARIRAADLGLYILPGMEITCDYNGRECHLLAYGFDTSSAEMIKLVQAQKLRRKKRAIKMISNLNKLGYDITLDEVMAECGSMNISRNHLASVLVSKGYIAHKKMVFSKYLGDQGKAYYKTDYMGVDEIVSIIRDNGGVTLLAHPGLYFVDDDIKAMLKSGIDGFECIHPSHNYPLQKKYLQICEENKLLKSGGSDFHGRSTDEFTLFGTVSVDLDWVNKIIERTASESI
ncbi:MAG: PHP domain-containing protein [Balneolales bacterium]|nr:PHP domain-containing protein [Balneolales bacterium]